MTRRDEIIDAALALAFDHGPAGVTTVAIAAQLGLTQPALYRHFRSRAELWAAITARLDAEVAANIDEARSLAAGPLERLNALVLGHLALVRKTPALPEILLARDPDTSATVKAAMLSRMRSFHHMLGALCAEAQKAGQIRDDLAPDDFATLILGVMQSLVLRLVLSRDPARLVEDGAHLLSLQLAAFAASGEV